MATIAERRDALFEFVRDALQAHDNRFKVERKELDYYRMVADDRQSRMQIMGDPVRYAELILRRPDVSTMKGRDVAGALHQIGIQSDLWVWFEYKDAKTYEGSSQAEFEKLIFNPIDAEKPGLLTQLYKTTSIRLSDWNALFPDPVSPDTFLAQLSNENEFVHVFNCGLLLT